MIKSSQKGFAIVSDNDGGKYIVETDQIENFEKWVIRSEEGKFDGMRLTRDFNKDKIDNLQNLIIYKFEEIE